VFAYYFTLGGAGQYDGLSAERLSGSKKYPAGEKSENLSQPANIPIKKRISSQHCRN
jgi:hypothetical protein